eukprot:2289319-Lingulodinium_polyedra.AAC.1
MPLSLCGLAAIERDEYRLVCFPPTSAALARVLARFGNVGCRHRRCCRVGRRPPPPGGFCIGARQ